MSNYVLIADNQSGTDLDSRIFYQERYRWIPFITSLSSCLRRQPPHSQLKTRRTSEGFHYGNHSNISNLSCKFLDMHFGNIRQTEFFFFQNNPKKIKKIKKYIKITLSLSNHWLPKHIQLSISANQYKMKHESEYNTIAGLAVGDDMDADAFNVVSGLDGECRNVYLS